MLQEVSCSLVNKKGSEKYIVARPQFSGQRQTYQMQNTQKSLGVSHQEAIHQYFTSFCTNILSPKFYKEKQ